MKLSVLAFFALFAVVVAGCSQVSPEKTATSQMEKPAGEEAMMVEEGFEMINGKMMMVNEKAKTTAVMEKDAVLNDGTKVMMDGAVIRPNGEQFVLKEGESMWMDGSFMEAGEMMAGTEEDAAMMSGNYQGTHLAGTTTPYLAFTKADYEKALSENKVILLNFYASWCPICKTEQKETTAFFDSSDREDVVGFRVNFKDSDTDADEEELAKQFGVPYQHTKVIVKDGKQVLKSLEQWEKSDYEQALSAV